MRWLAVILLLLAWPAWSNTPGRLVVATPGDPQVGMDCTAPDTAIDHWTEIGTTLGQAAGLVDIALLVGDQVVGQDNTQDCWCGAQAPGCELLTHPDAAKGDVCDAGECNDAQAIACKEGTPGKFCEYTRARNIKDAIQNSGNGIPVLAVNGNRDNDFPLLKNDWADTWLALDRWSDYNLYFGPSNETYLRDMVTELGFFQSTVVAGQTDGSAGSDVTTPWGSYMVIEAAGTQVLFIGVPYMDRDYLLSDPTEAYLRQILDAHPGMLTFLVSHMIIANNCTDLAYANLFCRDGWTLFTGKPIFGILRDYPQIAGTFSGHNRYIFRKAWTSPEGWKVINITVDYTNAIAGAPAWQTVANGGGGAIAYTVFDLVAGKVTSVHYSPEEADYINVTATEFQESRWSDTIPICDDPFGRWNLPSTACPERRPMNAQ